MKEYKDELGVTRELYVILREPVEAGCRLDLLVECNGAKPDRLAILRVLLGDVANTATRFFENYRMTLEP